MSHVAIYCRISADRTGRRDGVDQQERWGREYAASTWPGLRIEVYTDNDISASTGAHRPGYEALRADVQAGRVAHLWTVEQSRLERREAAWFELAAELDAAGITEVHTNRDGIVRVHDDVAGIKAVLAAGEVRRLRRRVNDRLDEIAAAGLPAGGLRFGYRHGVDATGAKTLHIEPAEAVIIRESAERVLSGWSLGRIAADLRARLITTRHGKPMTPGAVRKFLMAPTVAAKRVHRGEVVSAGRWEPILDEPTWQAVVARLSGPRTVATADGTDYPISTRTPGPARRYLLTGGVARCGVCGSPLSGSLKQIRKATSARSVPYLLCVPRSGGRGCVGIMLESVESYVVGELWDQLDRPEFIAMIGAGSDGDEARRDTIAMELTAIEARRTELAGVWAAGDLAATEWAAARRALTAREQGLLAELATIPHQAIDFDEIRSARPAWPLLNLDERRALIELFVEAVVIRRARPGTKTFDPGRVEIRWRVG